MVNYRTVVGNSEYEFPTPVSVAGAMRFLHFDVNSRIQKKTGRSLYGDAFRRASEKDLKDATTFFPDPQARNIIAIAAPRGPAGQLYTEIKIRQAIHTAFAGFRQSLLESRYMNPNRAVEVEVHTGNWGTGAFGGHKVLTAFFQIAAARAAGVWLVAHVMEDMEAWGTARDIFAQIWPPNIDSMDTTKLITAIYEMALGMEYKWGAGDGT